MHGFTYLGAGGSEVKKGGRVLHNRRDSWCMVGVTGRPARHNFVPTRHESA